MYKPLVAVNSVACPKRMARGTPEATAKKIRATVTAPVAVAPHTDQPRLSAGITPLPPACTCRLKSYRSHEHVLQDVGSRGSPRRQHQNKTGRAGHIVTPSGVWPL